MRCARMARCLGCVFLLAAVHFVEAAPQCGQSPLHCTINAPTDLQQVPTNLAELSLTFAATYDGGSQILNARLFPQMPSLVTLKIDIVNVNEFAADAFANLPALQTLEFTNSDIYRPHYEKTFRAGVFSGLSGLKTLIAVDVGVKVMGRDAVKDLVNLVNLNLTNNLLSGIEVNHFSANTKLEVLKLSQNDLSTLPMNAFSGLTQLKELHLQKLELLDIGTQLFSSLENLQTLKLNNNKISQLLKGSLGGLKNLTSLDLSSNTISTIQDGTFNDTTKLEFLKLFKNELDSVQSLTFQGLTSLSFLDAYDNSIHTIQTGAFASTTKLNLLHLQNNKISSIADDAFSSLADLSVLTLQNNQLTTLSQKLFQNFTQLNHLEIANNPLQCTCDIAWFLPWYNAAGSTFYLGNKDNIICSGPTNVAGTTLLQYLNTNYRICVPTTSAPTTTTTAKPTTVAATTTAAKTTQVTTAEVTTTSTKSERTTSITTAETTNIDSGIFTTDGVNNATNTTDGFGPPIELSLPLKAGIISIAIIIAFLLMIFTILCLYWRHTRSGIWRPRKTPVPQPREPKDVTKRDLNQLVYLARKEINNMHEEMEKGKGLISSRLSLNRGNTNSANDQANKLDKYAFVNQGQETTPIDPNKNKMPELVEENGHLNHAPLQIAVVDEKSEKKHKKAKQKVKPQRKLSSASLSDGEGGFGEGDGHAGIVNRAFSGSESSIGYPNGNTVLAPEEIAMVETSRPQESPDKQNISGNVPHTGIVPTFILLGNPKVPPPRDSTVDYGDYQYETDEVDGMPNMPSDDTPNNNQYSNFYGVTTHEPEDNLRNEISHTELDRDTIIPHNMSSETNIDRSCENVANDKDTESVHGHNGENECSDNDLNSGEIGGLEIVRGPAAAPLDIPEERQVYVQIGHTGADEETDDIAPEPEGS